MVGCDLADGLASLRAVAGKPNSERRIAAPPEPVAPARVRTLIVDDSEAVRDGLSRLLAPKPFVELVGAVCDPATAVARTRAAQPHVVLQDFSMPGIDPFDLIRRLTDCRPQPAVLVLSAFVDAPAARQAAEAGATGWVLKDAEPDQLFAALLGAAGFPHAARMTTSNGDTSAAYADPTLFAPAPPAEPEGAASLDARTVWALLRALAGDPAGLTTEGLATRAVLPVSVATRYVQRMTTRHPALVVPLAGSGAQDTFLLTSAGHTELHRLERRIPAERAQHAAQLH
jgi:DNA-binding NarL/FixJ family response regulator